MSQLGHTDAGFTLRVYAHAMRRDEGDKDRLKALVEGRDWAPLGTSGPNSASEHPRQSTPEDNESPADAGLSEDGRGGFRTCDLSRVKGLGGVTGGGVGHCSAVCARTGWRGAGASRTHWARCGHDVGPHSSSWVRYICGARETFDSRGLPRCGVPCYASQGTSSERLCRPRVSVVCTWRGLLPHSRRSRHTQPISGTDRRCPGQPVRAERSEPRSGGLDSDGRWSSPLRRSLGAVPSLLPPGERSSARWSMRHAGRLSVESSGHTAHSLVRTRSAWLAFDWSGAGGSGVY